MTGVKDGGAYLAAAYLVFLALLLIYLGVMAVRLSRMERELVELNELASKRLEHEQPAGDREAAEVSS